MSYSVTKSERIHIAFIGCTNSGKSSLVNAVTNQALSIVSDIKGTTTDAVEKAMEILPIGSVVIIDTAGLNDEGTLGNLRVGKTMKVLDKTDIAVLVIDSTVGINDYDKSIIKLLKEKSIQYIIAYNKSDLSNKSDLTQNNEIYVSAKTGEGVNELRELLGRIAGENKSEKFIIKDRLKAGDIVVLVIPIDESAPKGRVILPQQNVLREVLDIQATAICCQPEELEHILSIITPKFVITDSQAFNEVKKIVPENMILTSFSILMANYKGVLQNQLEGVKRISELQDGDTILISEGCTHHRQCNDIGTVKFPKWISNYTGKNINYEFTQGREFPEDLKKYKLIIHCGGCMLNEREMQSRIKKAKSQNVPVVNYGMAIAKMNGILDRAMKIFDDKN